MGISFRVVCGAVLSVALTTSVGAATYTATPITVGPLIPGTSGAFTAPIQWQVGTPNGTRYGNSLVPLPRATLGKMAQIAPKHPGIHIAIMALLAANPEWQWDSDTQKFKTPVVPGTEVNPGTNLPSYSCSTPDGWYKSGSNTVVLVGTVSGISGMNGALSCQAHGWQGAHKSGCANNTHKCQNSYPRPHTTDPTGGENVSDEELANVITGRAGTGDSTVNTSDPTGTPDVDELVQTIIKEIMKTPSLWSSTWPELEIERNAIIQKFLNYDPNTGDDMVDTSTDTPGAGDVEVNVEVEFPVFCEWAGIVCDFLDWFREVEEPPTDPELPTEEVEAWEQWNSGMPSTGACPAPRVTEYMGTSIEIPFSDFCYGLETYFRPIFIALAIFAAGFILVGARP